MREPKRLAHRQAERNKARALKQWASDDGEDDAELSYVLGQARSLFDSEEVLSSASERSYQL